jgi:hypothetical protein
MSLLLVDLDGTIREPLSGKLYFTKIIGLLSVLLIKVALPPDTNLSKSALKNSSIRLSYFQS